MVSAATQRSSSGPAPFTLRCQRCTEILYRRRDEKEGKRGGRGVGKVEIYVICLLMIDIFIVLFYDI